VPRLRGLPKDTQMRHDVHFVEALTSDRGGPIGRMIEILLLDPNPGQPRREFGDLSELVASIKEKGVLAPILVRPTEDGRFQIIAGERRYRAAIESGLHQVPCIELEVDDRGVMEISLIENLQRRDLSPFEEADAMMNLLFQHGYTHEMVARKLGKSRSTITETISLANIPQEIREECRRADISTRSTLLEIARCDTRDQMRALVAQIRAHGMTRDEARAAKHAEMPDSIPRARPFVFKFKAPDDEFSLSLQFKRPDVERSEVITTLRALLKQLEKDEAESTHFKS